MKKTYVIDEDTPNYNINISVYTHIRVYHACRPTNINSYLENGIHDFTREDAYQIAKSTLLQCGAEETEIERVFNESWGKSIHHFNRICVGISPEGLLNHSGHYLVYGSEFISGLAVKLSCQHRLKNIGVPTIFICDVEIDKISPDVLDFIKEGWYYNKKWDGGIYLRGNISQDEIVDYIQPKEMFDPIEWRIYRYEG